MGGGSWSTDVYSSSTSMRKASGRSAFEYDRVSRSSPRSSWRVHESLDPRDVHVRESRDSEEHPTSTPIAVLFDVTGSMGDVPRRLQEKLPALFGLLMRKGYVEHPQVLMGGVGDATCDRAPLQVGQFESDNRIDENLGNILLEGGGGGQMTESYELAMYFMARHTVLDSLEKRGKKGYLFLIGDELAYSRVKSREVRSVLGETIEEDISVGAIVAELKEKFEVFYILPEGTSYAGDATVLSFWRGLLGQNVLQLDDLDAVSETIALTVGLCEGTIDMADGLADLVEVGSTASGSVSRALATLPSRPLVSTSSVTRV